MADCGQARANQRSQAQVAAAHNCNIFWHAQLPLAQRLHCANRPQIVHHKAGRDWLVLQQRIHRQVALRHEVGFFKRCTVDQVGAQRQLGFFQRAAIAFVALVAKRGGDDANRTVAQVDQVASGEVASLDVVDLDRRQVD